MSFSGQSGMELLEKVRMQFSQTVRIVLSGSVSSDVVLKAADLAHQYIAKPFEEEDLIFAVKCAFFVKQLFDNASMAAVERKIIGTAHAAVGAYLLGLWGLPTPIIEAVAFHLD